MVEIDTTLDHTPMVLPLPLAIGVYYSPEFATKSISDKPHGGDVPMYSVDTYVFDVGAPSVELIDQACTRKFEYITHLSQYPPLPRDLPPIDAVLIPEIDTLDVTYIGGFEQSHHVSMEYRFALHTPTGEIIDEWATSGSAVKRHGPTFTQQKEAATAARMAMVEAISKLTKDFEGRPKVDAWLRSIGKHPGAEPQTRPTYEYPNKIRVTDQ